MKKVLICCILCTSSFVLAHPGALDSNFCHDSPTGYHCHKWDDDNTYTPEELGININGEETPETETVEEIRVVETKPTKERKPLKLPSIDPYVSVALGIHGMSVQTDEQSLGYVGLTATGKVGIEFDSMATYLLYDAAWFPQGDSIYGLFSVAGIGASYNVSERWYVEGGLGTAFANHDLTGAEEDLDFELSAKGLSWLVGAGMNAEPFSYGLSLVNTNLESNTEIDYSSYHLNLKAAFSF